MPRFADIFGQDEAIGQLRAAYASGRLPHALIFAGPVGVGKHATATALAGLFLCDAPTDPPDACGRCSSCLALAGDVHPDYHLVERKLIRQLKPDSKGRDLAIDVIRVYLTEPAGLTSSTGAGKVFVVDEADLMNTAAQNALLKTLEEPPPRTLIILLTDQPGQLLATIRSRARLVRFAALEEKAIVRELRQRGISPDDAASAARLSEGSLGLALRWLNQGVVAAAVEMLRRIDGLPASANDLPPWFKSFTDDFSEARLKEDAKLSADQVKREAMATMLRIAADHFRRQLPGADEVTAARLCDRIDAILEAERFIEGNVNLPLVTENLVAAWAGVSVVSRA